MGDFADWLERAGRDPVLIEVEADIRDELDSHLELCAEELERSGLQPDEAWAEARTRFGDVERISRRCRNTKLRGHLMSKRIPYVIIALLVVLTVGLYTRAQAMRAEAEQARVVAVDQMQRAMAMLQEREPPEPVEHVIAHVGDVIELLDRHRNIDFSEPSRIGPDGKALFRELGWVEVAGRTRDELTEHFNASYAKFYADLTIDVDIHQGED